MSNALSHITVIDKVSDYIKTHNLISPGEKILTAVSGGVDSMAMLHILHSLSQDLPCELAIAHFNHKLRSEESQRDADFVKVIAQKMRLPFFYDEWHHPPSSPKSIQAPARQARFDFLRKIQTEGKYDKIALAHHLDDRIETACIALLKGYGLLSLKSIPPQSGNIIHPLLGLSKQEITDYADANQLKWVEDSSNFKINYLRNKIRLKVLPQLEKIQPGFRKSLCDLSQEVEVLSSNLEALYDDLFRQNIIIEKNNYIILEIDKFLPYFNMLKNFSLRKILHRFVPELSVTQGFLRSIDALFFSAPGAMLFLSGIEITKDRGKLIFSLNEPASAWEIAFDNSYQGPYYSLQILPSSVDSLQLSDDPHIEFIDFGRVKGRLHLRFWRQGDRFFPLGLNESVKLSDFFINEKISRSNKSKIPLLCDQEKIIWICGKRLDNRVKITHDTKKYLKLIFTSEF